MTTRLIFIRHARSIWNDAGLWQGQANPPLGETGLAQARLLAERLRRGWEIDHLYASDLDRAATTAGIVGDALGLRPTLDPIWRERGIGELEGLTTAQIEARYPELWVTRAADPMSRVPSAEPTEAVLARAAAGCADLLARHPGESVVVISHGGMIQSTLVHLLELPPVAFGRLVGGYHTAISQVNIRDGWAYLDRLNDFAHLEPRE
jgi:broad specificity phosphatase PhoE